MHNWRRYPSLNWYKINQKMRFWIWHSAVVPSATEEKNCHIDLYTTTVHPMYQRYFEKFTSLWLLVHTNLFVSSHFGLHMRSLTTAVSTIWQHMEKILYRCTSAFSALNCCSGILFKCLTYLYEMGTHLFADFWTFHKFLTVISRKLCCHLMTSSMVIQDVETIKKGGIIFRSNA